MNMYKKPLPQINDLNAPYWEGAKLKELRLQKCRNCGRFSAEPVRLCMSCGQDAMEWVKASGRGKIWSFGIFHKSYFPSFAEEIPYNVVVVELEEGPRVYSNIVGVPQEEIKMDMPVIAYFDAVTEDVTLVKFQR